MRDPGQSALLTDLYQLTMLQAYHANRMERTAVFEFFIRRLPSTRNFLVAAGLEQVLDYLQRLQFDESELEFLANNGQFQPDLIAYLRALRFQGDVDAMPEGTIFFANEPVLRITAPLPVAQLVESRIINLLHFQTMIASKAVRAVLASGGRTLVDFGMRRAHGAEAALLAARAAYIAGFDSTSNVLAGMRFGIPISGTMAHSYIQAHASEAAAYRDFAVANPHNVTLLIDTYDTEIGAEKVVQLAPQLTQLGISIQAVRLDSGDLGENARHVRRILNRGGLTQVQIFASGSLDEYQLDELLSAGAPIDGFGVGTRLDVSADAPYLDCAYKMQEYAGVPKRKRSEGKATWPGRKQVFRTISEGVMQHDLVALESESPGGEPLLQPVMRGGERIGECEPLASLRQRVQRQLSELPESLRGLTPVEAYRVGVSMGIRELAARVDADTQPGQLEH